MLIYVRLVRFMYVHMFITLTRRLLNGFYILCYLVILSFYCRNKEIFMNVFFFFLISSQQGFGQRLTAGKETRVFMSELLNV